MLQELYSSFTTTTTNNPTTGTAGYYQLSVDPGTYAVMFMAPTGNTVSPSDAVEVQMETDSRYQSYNWKSPK
jgi:hypothetical protein